ncbi:MAG: hypothetical protein LBK99_24155 [Opitutaceae bacterium]|jgi:hypothetical protein|nr:hypothetical protein [Opitutaceae bacterium]
MATKAKIPISIDTDLLEKIRVITTSQKGGVSGWINEACKRKVRSIRRSEKRRNQIIQRRKAAISH